MSRKLGIGMVVGVLLGLGLTWRRVPEARAQKPRDEQQWEYKVGVFSFNPGERMTEEQRALAFEKALNENARKGWEPVGSILSRDSVQTIGGGVTTRDTTSFVAYRRPKR